MLILTYFLLLALFAGALIMRKKIMESTIGAIHKGALSLNNRVGDWGRRQTMENPSSPIAKLGYTRQWKKMQARREIYDKLRKKKAGQSSNSERDGEGNGVDNDMPPGNSGNPVENEIRDGWSGNSSDKTAYSRQHSDDTAEPANVKADGLAEQVQDPVDGLHEMPEEARGTFGWRTQGEQGEEQGEEVFGPWGDIPREARKPSKYGVPMEDGKMQTVYGSWEKTPEGPVLRENYWTLHESPRAYRIVKKDGKVFTQKIVDTGNEQNYNAQKGSQKTSESFHQKGSPVQGMTDSGSEASRAARAVNRKVNTRTPPQGSVPAQRRKTPVNTGAQQRRTPVDYGAKHFTRENKEKVIDERIGTSQAEGIGGGTGHGFSSDPENVNTSGNQDPTLKGRDAQGGTGSEPGAN